MTNMQLFFLLVIFAITVAMVFAVMTFLSTPAIKERLRHVAGKLPDDTAGEKAGLVMWVAKIVEPVSKYALPSEGWENSPMRLRFINAGYRGASAPGLYFALKTILTFALPGLFALYVGIGGLPLGANGMLLSLLCLAALGYYLPNLVLGHQINRRKQEIFENLPDALDLMTVCVEAGLGLDAAMARVGTEMRLTSPAIADEFHLANLELRAGSSREQSLRNLALRTGVEEVDSLVTMLIQADRFGTSVADSLRVHSDSLRTKRRLRAEETAAKMPVKLLFPMIFFIFPSLLLVLLGPAIINVYRALLPAFGASS